MEGERQKGDLLYSAALRHATLLLVTPSQYNHWPFTPWSAWSVYWSKDLHKRDNLFSGTVGEQQMTWSTHGFNCLLVRFIWVIRYQLKKKKKNERPIQSFSGKQATRRCLIWSHSFFFLFTWQSIFQKRLSTTSQHKIHQQRKSRPRKRGNVKAVISQRANEKVMKSVLNYEPHPQASM